MNFFNFITRAEEKAFVANQIEQLVKDLPPMLIAGGRGKVTVNKITRCLERVYSAVSDFNDERHLGFIGRAVVANAFKWGLKEASYPGEFVDMATEGLIVALSKVKAQL